MKNALFAPAVVVALSSTVCWAQYDEFDPFFRHNDLGENKVVFNEGPVEQINFFNGNLHLVHTDLHLPGKNGLDLRIQRSYSSRVWGRVDFGTGEADDALVAAKELMELGFGWSLHMGRYRDNGFGSSTQINDAVFEEPDGTTHRFFNDSFGNDYLSIDAQISEDLWVEFAASSSNPLCQPGTGITRCVVSPAGITYRIGSDIYTYPGGGYIAPVEEIVDPLGNTIDIEYDVG